MGFNSFLSHETNATFNFALGFGTINAVFVGSCFYDTTCVVNHTFPITNRKDNSNCQCQLLQPSPVTVIFNFLFDETFMEAGYYYNMLGLVVNIRVSLSDAYYQDHLITHQHNATAFEEQIRKEQASLDPQHCHKYSNGFFSPEFVLNCSFSSADCTTNCHQQIAFDGIYVTSP